jgi:hypothetical protein
MLQGSISISNSQVGVNYQLKNDGGNVQDPKAGTGGTLTWTGLPAGNYLVQATNATPPSCGVNSAPAEVIQNGLPGIQADDKKLCVGQTVVLTGTIMAQTRLLVHGLAWVALQALSAGTPLMQPV